MEFLKFDPNVTLKGHATFSLAYFRVVDNFSHQQFLKLHGKWQCPSFIYHTILLLAGVDNWSTCLQGESVYELAVELFVIFSLFCSLSVDICPFCHITMLTCFFHPFRVHLNLSYLLNHAGQEGWMIGEDWIIYRALKYKSRKLSLLVWAWI